MKVHLRETKMKPEDWKQSPHIFRALTEGTCMACTAGICAAGYVTTNPKEITCKAYLNTLEMGPAEVSRQPGERCREGDWFEDSKEGWMQITKQSNFRWFIGQTIGKPNRIFPNKTSLEQKA